MYPWPFGELDAVMDDALDISMDYLARTGQAVKFEETQATAANAIGCAWRAGVRNHTRLSNLAIIRRGPLCAKAHFSLSERCSHSSNVPRRYSSIVSASVSVVCVNVRSSVNAAFG